MILRNSDLLNKFNPQPYDGMPKNKKGTEEPIIDKSKDEVETFAYAKKADRERWKELMDKTKALMTTAQGRKLWYQDIKPQNLSIEELQRFTQGVKDYNKEAQDYQRARRKAEEGKIDSSAFARMYDERGWSKFDPNVMREGYKGQYQDAADDAIARKEKNMWLTDLALEFTSVPSILRIAKDPIGTLESVKDVALDAAMKSNPTLSTMTGNTNPLTGKEYWENTQGAFDVLGVLPALGGMRTLGKTVGLADDVSNIGKLTNKKIPLKNVTPTEQESLLASFSYDPRLKEAINEANDLRKMWSSNKAPINKVEESTIYNLRGTGSNLTKQEAKALYEEQDKISDAAYDFYMRYTMGNDYESKLAAFDKIKKETDITVKKMQDLNLKDSNLYSMPAYKKYEEFSSEARNMFWRQNSSRSHTAEFSEDLAKFEKQQRAKFIEENPETKAIFDELDQIQTEKTSLNEVWQKNLKVIPEEYFDPTFLKKIEDITGQPVTNSDLFHGELVDISKIKDKIKLASTNPNDPVVKAMSAEDYASFNKNSLGVRTETMTGTKRGNFSLEPKLNDSGEWVYQPTETLNPAEEIGFTSAHELGHDRQKLFDWNTFLEKHDPVYNYRVNNEKSLLAQDMKKIMAKPSVDPTSTSYTYNTWRAAPSELDSDLFGQKFRHYYDTKNQYGQETADKLLENLRTFNKESFDPLEWEKYYEKQLSDHFLSEEKYNSAFLNNQRNLVDSKLEELYGTDNYFDWLTGAGANKGGESSKIFKEMDETAKTIKASLPSQTQENYHTLKNSILQRLPVVVPGAIGIGLGAYSTTNTDLRQGYSHGGFVDNNPKKDLNSFLLKQKMTQGTPLRYRNTERINLNLDKGQSSGPDFYKYGNLGTGDGNIVGVLGAGIPSKGLEANLLGVVPTQRNPYFGGFYNLGVQKQFPNSSLGLNLGMATSKESKNTFEPSVTYKRNFKEGGSLAPNIPTYYNFEGTPIYRDTTSLPFENGGKRKKRKNDSSSDNEHWKNVVTGKELQRITTRDLEDFELKKYIATLPNIPYSQNDFNSHISTDEAIKRAHTAGNREEEDYLRSLKEQGIEKIQSFGEVTVSANKDVEKKRLKLLDEWRILNNTIKKYHKEKGLPDWQGAYAGTDMKKLQANIKDLRQRYEQEKDYYKEVSKTLDLLKKEMPEKYGDVKLKNFLTADTYTDINKDLRSIDKKYALGKGENVTATELDKALGIKLNSAKSFMQGIARQFDPLGYNMSKEDWQQWKNQHFLGNHNLFYDAQGFSENTNKLIMGLLAGAGGAAVQGQIGANMLKGLNWIGETGVGPVTINNILSGYSAYHLGHSVPKFVMDPTWRNLGSMSLDAVGALPIGVGIYGNIPKIQDTSKALRMWSRDAFNPAINKKINFWDAFKYDDYINIGDPSKLAGYRGALINRPQATTGRWYSHLSDDPIKAEETLKYLLPASELGQGRHGMDILSDVNRYLARRGQLSAEGQATGQLSRVGTKTIEKELNLLEQQQMISSNYLSFSKRKFTNAIEKLIEKRRELESIPIASRTEQDTLKLISLNKAIQESSLLEGKMRSIPRPNEIEELLPGFQQKHNLTDSQINLVRDFSKKHSSYFTLPEYTANTEAASALRKAMRDPTFVSESEYLMGIPKNLVEITPSNWSSVKNIITNPSKQGTREFILEHPELAASYKYLNAANELRPVVRAIHEYEIIKTATDNKSSGGSLNFKKNKIYKTSELY